MIRLPTINTATSRELGCRSSGTPTVGLFRFMIYLFLDAVVETCASFNFLAQSSQHTSTVLPPILTLMELTSSLQSQAAQVVATMTSLKVKIGGNTVEVRSED